MGYMGFGLQKWIYSQKPRKPFKKRESTLGQEYIDTERNFSIEGSFVPNPNGVEERIENSKKRNRLKSKLEKIQSIIFLIMFFFLAIIIIIYIRKPTYNNNQEGVIIIDEEYNKEIQRDINLFIKTGKDNLEWNYINSSIEEFERALKLDPNNIEALNYYVLALSIDCEQNNKNCDKAMEFYEKIKSIDESKIIEGLKIRIEIVDDILKKK